VFRGMGTSAHHEPVKRGLERGLGIGGDGDLFTRHEPLQVEGRFSFSDIMPTTLTLAAGSTLHPSASVAAPFAMLCIISAYFNALHPFCIFVASPCASCEWSEMH
jgi:hypothetical protein